MSGLFRWVKDACSVIPFKGHAPALNRGNRVMLISVDRTDEVSQLPWVYASFFVMCMLKSDQQD